MRKWIMTTIQTNKQANAMLRLFDEQKPTIGGFDSEDDDLHIILANMFLFQFGWLHPTEPIGYTFAVDIERQPDLARQVIRAWKKRASTLTKYAAHNVKFDMHMLTNYGEPYLEENLTDTMYYIRAAHDAISTKHGGAPLKLKDYAVKYISRKAKDHDQLIQKERSDIARDLNLRLSIRLKATGAPPPEYGYKSYTIGCIEAIFKDCIAESDYLPTPEARMAYDDWLHLDVPAQIRHKVTGIVDSDIIPYSWCDREVVTKYAHYDIVWLLELIELTSPVITARGTWNIVEVEESLILPLYEMERVGFNADVEYLKNSKVRMREYIARRRQDLVEYTGETFSIAQHAKVKSVLNNMGVDIDATGDEIISKARTDLLHTAPDDPAIKVIEIIQELRTLEKWYSTYVLRFLYNLEKTDVLYTTINSVGCVGGRVTSDFQQFPKNAIKTVDGEELFHPRKIIRVFADEKYPAIFYLDYSQIELRFQALYTILVGHPDLNLCRAYMPFRCVNPAGELFDFKNKAHVQNWRGEWYLEEDRTKRWTPTDVHAATTMAAFDITPEHPDFHSLRYVGKRVNFAKNYGAKFYKIWSMFPEYSEEAAHKIDDAYYKAFPGVKQYHTYCYQRADTSSYTQNLFGMRYYGVSGHNLINMLVQGSAAYFLKMKIRALYEYTKAHNIKSKWQMQIHDELSWAYCSEDSPEVIFEFQRIMQDWDDALVPIVADLELTLTTWADKVEVKTIEELRAMLPVPVQACNRRRPIRKLQ